MTHGNSNLLRAGACSPCNSRPIPPSQPPSQLAMHREPIQNLFHRMPRRTSQSSKVPMSFPAFQMRMPQPSHEFDRQRAVSEGGCAVDSYFVIRIINHTLHMNTAQLSNGAEVVLNWLKDADTSNTELESLDIPVNPAVYDTYLTDSLPFDHDDSILLAKFEFCFGRKFLWLCLSTRKLFWLIGCIPDTISTWRESMLRRCKLELNTKKAFHCVDADGTVLFKSAKRFSSKTPSMEDIMEQRTRKRQNFVVSVDKSSKTPLIEGAKFIPNNIRVLLPHQIVPTDTEHHFKMGQGIFAKMPVVPMRVSVQQVCQSLPALDCAAQPTPFSGDATLIQAMMDVDCAVFAMSAGTRVMEMAKSAESIIKLLKKIIPNPEQRGLTMFIPSGEWQRVNTTGPTVRPVNGGSWWQLPSPKHSREPLKVWIHSSEFIEFTKMKSASLEIAHALFEEFDSGNPERSAKLQLENTQFEVKVPGGFLFPLALSVMIWRLGTDVTIFLETFGNKSYGMKLNALDPVFGSFANDSWADNVATRFLVEWKNSILQMLTKLTDTISGCFNIKHEHTSIGFGFSTSYCDSKYQPLYSVCKSADWISTAGYESYCTMALHSLMSPHTTHFASGPVLRVQSYIEAFNCITDRQCGSRKSLYTHVGFSALDKISSGEINVSAVLGGFNDDFVRINNAINAMGKSPRNRTEIQIKCILNSTGSLDLKSMMQTAASIIRTSSQHWQLSHILSYSSLNAAAMFLIAQQSWRLACDAEITLKTRQSLLDIANEILNRWKSFKTGRGNGTIGPKDNKRLIAFPKLYEPLISHLNSMLPLGEKRFRCDSDNIQIFTDHDIVTDNSFGDIMNKRIEKNRTEDSNHLSQFIMKCCTCGELFYGDTNRDDHELHFSDNPGCMLSDWSAAKMVTARDWDQDFSRRLRIYDNFIKDCSKEQRDACESVLKFGTGILAVGIAGAGKSFALNQIGMILEAVFYEPGELVRCASTGLLAQYFHSSATTVHSAIGAYPSFGSTPSWNLSTDQWRKVLEDHGKLTKQLKVFINTEVYAQSSNMLQALFEIRKKGNLKFVPILDGDPPQPMHEDEDVADSHANLLLCGLSDHLLLSRTEIRRILPDIRIIHFETPMRQKDPLVHELSTAVRYAKTKIHHIELMRQNEYDPKKHKVDAIICAMRKDAARINYDRLKQLPGRPYEYWSKSTGTVPLATKGIPLILKVNAPIIFNKGHTWYTIDNIERKVVNGTRGIIHSCDETSVVVALNNTKVKVRVQAIQLIDGKNMCQLPIQLGWATTIKKAAGMTFDTVAINFGLDWNSDESKLIQQAQKKWRTSQVYGAITRPRKLAYFCDASKFKVAPMLALANNQNVAALKFLSSLTQCQEQYVRTEQDLRSLWIQGDGLPAAKRPKRIPTQKLMDLIVDDKVSVSDHVWADQWPQTLTRQEAGSYCSGVLMSNGKKVLIKTSNHLSQQDTEIQALRNVAGVAGIPELIGMAENHLVFSHNGAVPLHGTMQSHHINDLQRILHEIHQRGWTFKFVSRQNVWTYDKSVMLFNFENSVRISESTTLITIDDFIRAFQFSHVPFNSSIEESTNSVDEVESHENQIDNTDIASDTSVSEANGSQQAATLTTGDVSKTQKQFCSVYIHPFEEDLFAGAEKFNQAMQKWELEEDAEKCIQVSKLWDCTHQKVYENFGPRTSWESGLKGHRPESKGYGEATSELCICLRQIHETHAKKNRRPVSDQTFVDIGSGICNIVVKMAVLQPKFKYSFGIEIVENRAFFAQKACDDFTKNAAKEGIPFCSIQAENGSCFDDTFCEGALKHAGLVWINNEIFKAADNLRLYGLLNSLVPLGCIIVSFVEVLNTRTRSGHLWSTDASDFESLPPIELKKSNHWEHPDRPKKVFIIQRMRNQSITKCSSGR
jgi:hypothetical protein